ncbi:ESX secretion-associated protein EspG [Gordonia soli]|uniref:ESX secretion-associated protein EspG n=1 Tax=Gordonia soli NBRC 108243 TaxID=1223545 RepID=M0QCB4_9ACTN|nr:ESX secretion-associated protein EspG [Gordonia soli]GAC66205.1 hypothetical protein GS4_01_00060 [Gordonia soli NBRC 108243]
MMTRTDERTLVLDTDVLQRLGERCGVQTWPVVLGLRPRYDDAVTALAAARRADQEIATTGLLADGEPATWLATALRVLSTPERLLEVRTFSETDSWRMCVARNGFDHAVAVRRGDTVEIGGQLVTGTADLGAIVRRRLGDAPVPDFVGISAPAGEIADRLARCQGPNDTADALHAVGAGPVEAGLVGAALASCRARTEIVAVSSADGISTQSSGALAVLDTDRGRIVASPSRSPDGRVWTTLSPGTGHRIAQAVGLLIETVPEGRWMP